MGVTPTGAQFFIEIVDSFLITYMLQLMGRRMKLFFRSAYLF